MDNYKRKIFLKNEIKKKLLKSLKQSNYIRGAIYEKTVQVSPKTRE